MKLILAVLFGVSAIICSPRLPEKSPYRPLFSLRYPLATPGVFWASLLGMRRLAADIVWIQAFQYYGERYPDHTYKTDEEREAAAIARTYPELLSYWQQVIRLDPIFSHAYLTGATTLAWNLNRHSEAMELLDEGIEHLEDLRERVSLESAILAEKEHLLITGKNEYFEELLWKMKTLRTLLIYMRNDEFRVALPSLGALSMRKDIPDDLRSMIAQIYERNDYLEEAFRQWALLHGHTTDPALKEIAERRLLRLHSKLKELEG